MDSAKMSADLHGLYCPLADHPDQRREARSAGRRERLGVGELGFKSIRSMSGTGHTPGTPLKGDQFLDSRTGARVLASNVTEGPTALERCSSIRMPSCQAHKWKGPLTLLAVPLV
jgi:hypothetical protein